MERRNKKSGNYKKTPLYKNDDGKMTASKSNQCVAPRILMKAKEKDCEKKPEPTITIATKAGNAQQPQPGDDSKNPRSRTTQDVAHPVAVVNTITESVNLLSVNNVLNIYAFNYLHDTNSDFFVIGAVGTQYSGKSTVLNLLASTGGKNSIEQALRRGVFPTNDIFSRKGSKELDEEIRMFITMDRIVLLDSAPVMSSRGRKDFIIGEMDDLRRILLLFNTCHVLIVMLEDDFNINFIRLLLCAEMMIQKEQKNAHHLSPRLVFVKNKCEPKKSNFQEVAAYENIYKQLFNGSKLKIFSSEEDCERLNMVALPDLSDDSLLTTDAERLASVEQLRQRIFMSPKYVANEAHEGFNEKMWSQLVTTVLEEHHNNYFLRKYENLSEKYNLHNHINVAESASKEKNYLSFIDT
uniref:Protein SMG9 n=2 Tax=Culex pipiens TaxID=7175 RepID=A0A8D8CAD0_CULPI